MMTVDVPHGVSARPKPQSRQSGDSGSVYSLLPPPHSITSVSIFTTKIRHIELNKNAFLGHATGTGHHGGHAAADSAAGSHQTRSGS